MRYVEIGIKRSGGDDRFKFFCLETMSPLTEEEMQILEKSLDDDTDHTKIPDIMDGLGWEYVGENTLESVFSEGRLATSLIAQKYKKL